MKRVFESLVGIALCLGVAAIGFRSCAIPTGEWGYLGVDADGRSALAYMLTLSSPTSVVFSTEFYDRHLLSRLWRPPMNTTLRMGEAVDPEIELMMRIQEGFARTDMILEPLTNGLLTAPADAPLYGYDPIHLSRTDRMPANEFLEMARSRGVRDARDMLRGFGFTTVEFSVNSEKKVTLTLNTNVINASGNEFKGVIGSSSNSPCALGVEYHWGWKRELPSVPRSAP